MQFLTTLWCRRWIEILQLIKWNKSITVMHDQSAFGMTYRYDDGFIAVFWRFINSLSRLNQNYFDTAIRFHALVAYQKFFLTLKDFWTSLQLIVYKNQKHAQVLIKLHKMWPNSWTRKRWFLHALVHHRFSRRFIRWKRHNTTQYYIRTILKKMKN